MWNDICFYSAKAPRVTSEQIEEGPEGDMGEQRSISHFKQLCIQLHIGIGWMKAKYNETWKKMYDNWEKVSLVCDK